MTRLLTSCLSAQSWIRPAGHAGGDFVVSVRTAPGWRIVLGDVSGHGDDVADTARLVQSRIEQDIAAPLNPDRIRTWNRDLHAVLAGRFVCLTCLDVDKLRGSLTVANAGNPAVLVRRADGRVDSYPGTGPIVGLLDDCEWTAPVFVTTPLSPSDRILCFTDGLTERFNADREPFGLERVIRLASRACQSPVRMIRRCVRSFARSSLRQDDVTLLLLQAA